jgi:Zn-dependent protease
MSGEENSIKIAIISFVLSLPIFMLAFSIHEYAHGFVANKLGDPTAKSLGRLTLNPIKHIDLFGFLAMLLFGFGWAKPVPINTRYFKKPKRDMAITALAGPLSNILLAIFFGALFKAFSFVSLNVIQSELAANIWMFTGLMLSRGIYINVLFAVFNMMPVPPFDGSRLFLAFLPTKAYFWVQRYERYIYMVFLALLILGIFDYPLSWLTDQLCKGIVNLYFIPEFLRTLFF